jgi:DNA-binding transcriptional LysR family regulator
VYQWQFEKDDQSLTVAVTGSLITDDQALMEQAALNGVGLVFTVEQFAAPYIARGALVRVLEDWCQPFPGFFLYYPSRHQQPAALTALIATLRI